MHEEASGRFQKELLNKIAGKGPIIKITLRQTVNIQSGDLNYKELVNFGVELLVLTFVGGVLICTSHWPCGQGYGIKFFFVN